MEGMNVNIELNPDEPLPEWMLAKNAEETDSERVIDLLEEALGSYERLGRIQRRDVMDLIATLEEHGLKLELI